MLADGLYLRIALHNYSPHTLTVPLALVVGADFADVFEVRGVRKQLRTRSRVARRLQQSGVRFSYEEPTTDGRTFELQPGPHELASTAIASGRAGRCSWPRRPTC